TGKQLIVLRDPDKLPSLHLIGPGALNYWAPYQSLPRDRPDPVRLAPGETHTIRIFSLGRHWGDSSFWLLPGDYTIAGHYWGAISPAPKGADAAPDGYGYVTIRFAPIKVKVLPAKEIAIKGSLADIREIHRRPPPGTVIVPKPDDGSAEVRRKLGVTIKFDGMDAGTPLKDAVDFLSDRYELDIRIDEAAFKKVGKKLIGQ